MSAFTDGPQLADLIARLPKNIRWSIEYDVNYGILKRTGFSVAIDGVIMAELCATPEDAMRVALAQWETAE